MAHIPGSASEVHELARYQGRPGALEECLAAIHRVQESFRLNLAMRLDLPARWLLIVFVLLLLAFTLVLLFEPAIGRGGR